MTFLYFFLLRFTEAHIQASCVGRWEGEKFHTGLIVLYYCFESKDFTNYLGLRLEFNANSSMFSISYFSWSSNPTNRILEVSSCFAVVRYIWTLRNEIPIRGAKGNESQADTIT
jgi:hypothetical protein